MMKLSILTRLWLKISRYIDEILSIYRLLVMVDMISTADYRLIEISTFYREFIVIIDDISDFPDIFTDF